MKSVRIGLEIFSENGVRYYVPVGQFSRDHQGLSGLGRALNLAGHTVRQLNLWDDGEQEVQTDVENLLVN